MKARIASSAENSAAPASMTKPTTMSARATPLARRAGAAIPERRGGVQQEEEGALDASSPPLACTPAAASMPAAPMSAATPARMKG